MVESCAQIVWTPNKATVLLGENWPAASGVAYFDAVDKCSDAMVGTYPWEQARVAFIAAIAEAKVTRLR
ncbi:DUF982 domain-containing protein [Ensifer sp. ENS06]|uniref:DUF982 domain-containing protein n=1 Tax=Ensifer sp. ENS06 TaxID=2769276 RepID=UPI0028111D67|nr:DUF982 domain-containing protein [Ensifer sp. ENS06]